MIGQTWPEYVFISLSIFVLRLVALLSAVYLAASWSAGTFLWSPVFGVYELIETLCFLLVYLPRCSHLQRVRIRRIIAHHRNSSLTTRMPNTRRVCPAPNVTHSSTIVQTR